jgi:hopene-associated glycosyltransferase HpnB
VSANLAIAGIAAAVWIYLLAGRGGFWRGWREPSSSARQHDTCEVAVIVPARNEAALIGDTLAALFAQDYPGKIQIIVIDDHSTDGTAEIARQTALAAGAADRLTVIAAPPLPPGWAGKVWAMQTGFDRARSVAAAARYVLFTDADIRHGSDLIRRLVGRAEAARLDLVSLMVRLRCRAFAERALVPAFVYFFRMLYPFAWVADRRRATAAAAGGCMLVRREALDRIGGLSAIRSRLIDDCALAGAIKPGGDIRLDVADTSLSARAYEQLGDIWRMIARSAYTELRYSPLRLACAVIGMILVFLMPPVLALGTSGPPAWLGGAAWTAMAISFLPCLRYYRASPAWAPALPLIALFYLGATIDSARQHWLGRGGAWKGRAQSSTAG